jgi:hypothetical protein
MTMTSPKVRCAASVFLAACSLFSTTDFLAQAPSQSPPGSIRLLPGYTHSAEQGIDSAVGRISRPKGPIIFYDIGPFGANNNLSKAPNVLWSKTQIVKGEPVTVAMRDDQTLLLAVGGTKYPSVFGSFMARDVKSKEDVVDVLLMLLTYQSSEMSEREFENQPSD